MDVLWIELSQHMKQKRTNKTMSFAVKMYGYAIRIISNHFVPYPISICIPLDSRLMTIYKKDVSKKDCSDDDIISYYQFLAEKNNIAPLHLDSLLWIDYREKYC